jgi:leader peptidase (prepilin peptidase) / N-methyltransferase
MPVIFLVSSLLMFLVGAAVGSFVNVVLYRTVRSEQWLWGRSKCDHCGKPIPWYLNIPLVSFLMLKGKTACCRKTLSISHPVVETLVGSLFVWWYWGLWFFFHLTSEPFQVLQPLFWLIVGFVLILILIIDYNWMIIPDELTILLTILTVAYRVVLTVTGIMQTDDFVNTMLAAVGAVSFFGTLWTVTRGRGLGFGDVKLVFALTLLMGWPKMLVGFFASFVSGAVIGVILLASGRHKRGQPIPFGPFLILGTVLSLVVGQAIWDWYSKLLMI